MEITFERACEADAEQLTETRSQSFYADYVRFGECPGYHIPPEEMRKYIRESQVYKIFADGRFAGDISVRKIGEGEYRIGCLAVVPEYQRRGIGKTAVAFAESLFPDARRFHLDTPVQNEGNCRFYENLGFAGISEKRVSDVLTLREFEKVLAREAGSKEEK